MTKQTPETKAAWIIERDLSILTGPELAAKYAKPGSAAAQNFERVTGRHVREIAPTHHPFYYYMLAVWFDNPDGKGLLYEPTHRDIMAADIENLILGRYDDLDGLHLEASRRGLKSTMVMAGCDWAAKRHKIIDGLDVIQFYVHNIYAEAVLRVQTIKDKNRYHSYIETYFPEFHVSPEVEWDTKEAFNWKCRGRGGSVTEPSVKALSFAGKKAGKGAHYRWLDDCEDEESRMSKTVREDSLRQYDQLRSLAAPAFSRECFINTPYHIHGLTLKLKDAKDDDGKSRYKVTVIPARNAAGALNFPTIKRLSEAGLEREKKNEIARTGSDLFWHLQYMLEARVSGSQTFEWKHFQKLTRREYEARWAKVQHFRFISVDSAWKGEDNQGEGDDTVIGVIGIWKRADRMDWVLLDATVSREYTSDEGAAEICRLGKKWRTPYVAPEMTGEKTFVGTMRMSSKIHHYYGHIIDLGGFSKKHKTDRLMQMAGHARIGLVHYLEDVPHLPLFQSQVEDHPQVEHEDFVDMFSNAWASVILEKWCPIEWGYTPEDEVEAVETVPLSRYTGIHAYVS